jgi:peptide/nickel transport system substrate-binding protein
MHQPCVRSIVLIVLGLVWAGLVATWAEQPKPGGTLRVAFEADATGLDPAIPGLQNYYVNQNLFNTLVTLDENLEFVPDLAESWEIQEQGKMYLFHLRRGVKFHDGTDFDAAAVKWNLDRIMADEKAPAHRFFANVESSEVLDAHTLKITMRRHPRRRGGRMCSAIRREPDHFALSAGSRTHASSWSAIPTISSQDSHTWTASSTAS